MLKTLLRTLTLTLVMGSFAAAPAFAEKAEKKADADVVVAKVDGKPAISRADVIGEFANLPPQIRQLPEKTVLPQIVNQLLMTRIVSDAGYAEKLQNDPEVKKHLKEVEQKLVAQVYLDHKVAPLVTNEKLMEAYKKLVNDFKPVDEVKARHILVKTESEASELIKQINDGADFAKLAAEKSSDTASAKQGGDLGYFSQSDMVKAFADAAFAMKAGDVSKAPVKTDFGYHVIKVEDRRKSSPPQFEQVKSLLSQQVGQEVAAQVVDGLKKKVKIELFQLDGSPMPTEAEMKAAAEKAEKAEKADKK